MSDEQMDVNSQLDEEDDIEMAPGSGKNSATDSDSDSDSDSGSADKAEAAADEGDSDDDDLEDDDEDDDIKLIKKYMELLERVSADKYNYDDYVLLVNTAHEMTDLDKIRQSCELFAGVYPLAPDIWLRWLRIELNIASTEAEYEKVHQLFRRALGDYYSTTVALEYANLAIRAPKSHETWEVLISTYTLHCTDGAQLFAAWRQHCAATEPAGPAKCAKLVQMYEQQLSLPLAGAEETYVEFKVMCERDKELYDVDWPRLDASYAAAKEQLAQCLPFEQRLAQLQPHEHQTRSAVYAEYIAAAKPILNGRIVQVLHERWVTDCCLSAGAWLAYIRHIQLREGQHAATNPAEQLSLVFGQTDWDVCNRALRNCTWSAELYVEKLRIAERMELCRDEVRQVAEQALAAGIQRAADVVAVWLEYLGYLRRTVDLQLEKDCELLRAAFGLAWDSVSRQFGEAADEGGELLQMWGRLEYGPMRDGRRGRELWLTMMRSGANGGRAAKWMDLVGLEERSGGDGVRKIFRKALATPQLDDLDAICSAWTRFERCKGTLEQLKFAQRECAAAVAKAQQSASASSRSAAPRSQARVERNGHAGRGDRRDNLKRKAASGGDDQRPEKRRNNPRADAQPRAGQAKASSVSMGPPGAPAAKQRRPEADKQPAEAVSQREAKTAAKESAPDAEWHQDTSNDAVTIFLSNLAYSTTEEEIEAAFPELVVENVHLIRSANGNSRGFSYVKLGAESQVQLALGFDRRLINGRPTFISSVLRDKEQRPKFKYSAEMEPTKLFVKGLSFESTKEELAEVFGVFGAVKDVRLVLQKNGKPKGLAYVEYHEEKAASKAIMQLDQTEVRGFKISVALSAPPPKAAAGAGAVSAAATLGHGRRAAKAATLGDIKPRLSFIPRVVQKLAATSISGDSAKAAANAEAATSASTTAKSATAVPKTNADFRKFLTQSK